MRQGNKAYAVFIVWLLFFNLLSFIPGISRAQDPNQNKVLEVGILPTLSSRVLIKNYQPLQTYLERRLQRPVELTTARDFKTFHQYTLDGKYDVVVTAAHLARLAQTEAKFIPLAVYKAANGAILIQAKDQPLRSIHDIKGKVLGFGDRNALNVIQTLGYLREQGLKEGVDYTLLDTSSHTSAAYAVQNHQTILSVTSPSGYKNIPEAIRSSVEIYTILPTMPSLTWMANPRISSEIPKIKTALLEFTPESEEGKQFFDVTGYIGMREISNEEMKALEPFAQDIKYRLRMEK